MIDLSTKRHIHFIGIGGIMMSGIAEMLQQRTFLITGSDQNESERSKNLINLGIKVFIGHDSSHVQGSDLVVYTSAISDDNPEYLEAKKKNIPMLSRAEMIGLLMPEYNTSVAVSGAHGKTTTTSMISNILNTSDYNPTVLVGGITKNRGSNVQIGDHSVLLLEACEYKENFLSFNHNLGIILNIDEDHLDFFNDLDHIISAFIKFAKKIPTSGVLILNNDDYNARKVVSHVDCEVITFGINTESTFQVKNITFNNHGHSKFDVYYKEDFYGTFFLRCPGQHNIYNALASIVAAYVLEIPVETIIESVKSYDGTERRFEILGTYKDALIIDDYAHHPNEIKATLLAAQKLTHNKITCIFQPHTYTRTRDLMLQFASAFNEADQIIITDIYAAREDNSPNVHAKDLVKAIAQENENVKYIEKFEDIVSYIQSTVRENDLVLTLGAGNIRTVGESILKSPT
jgi:UDP-N-acetylmuramate--alanine ligase